MRGEIDRLLRENERLRRDRRDGGGDGDRRNDRFDDEAGDGGRSNALVPWGRSSDLVPQMHGARGSSKMSAGKTQEFLRREAAMKRTNEAIGSGLRSESGAYDDMAFFQPQNMSMETYAHAQKTKQTPTPSIQDTSEHGQCS